MLYFRPEYDGVGGKLRLARFYLFWAFCFLTLAFYGFQVYVLYQGLPGAINGLFGWDIGAVVSLIVSVPLGLTPVAGNFVASYVGMDVLGLPYGASFGLFMFLGLGLFPLTYKVYPEYYRHLVEHKNNVHYRDRYDAIYADGKGPTRKERLAAERRAAEEHIQAEKDVRKAFDYLDGKNDDPENAQLAKFIQDVKSHVDR